MEKLGLPMKFMPWIMECVNTVNYSIVVNGEFIEPFDAEKGFKQGGLNVVNLHLWNKASQTKVFWDLTHKEDKLWIQGKYWKLCPFQGATRTSYAHSISSMLDYKENIGI
uniref:Uncharacterized protein n=1 Tax=Solanum lycopersicum TaxID=4081 RepID=A0A3Q7J9A0_SOLLC